MSPILSRLYSAPGGTEALDVLMKYMYVAAQSGHTPPDRLLPVDGVRCCTSLCPIKCQTVAFWASMADNGQLQGHGSLDSRKHIAEHHSTSHWLFPGPCAWRRRGRRAGHERAAKLAREGTQSALSYPVTTNQHPMLRIRWRIAPTCANAAQLVEIAGPGSIVRVMTDRRTV
jgi:hypothetical protein